MNDDQKRVLGTVLAVGLILVVGTALIGYSLAVAGGALPSPVQKDAEPGPAQSPDDRLLAAAGPVPLVAPENVGAPSAQAAAEGQAIFQAQCVACHTIGGGTLVGPDLAGVTARRDRAWLARWISVPDQVLAEGDPIAAQLLQESNNVPMPNLGLTEAQVAALIAYLETQAGLTPASQAASAPALPAGNSVLGKDLFTGAIRFQNGGPPCMACHSIAGIGALGGGALGPDLTPAFNKYTEAGLASFLNTMPLPTMNAVWSPQPLTPEEQANLRVFLQQASVAGRPIQATGRLALLAVGGTAIVLALAHLVWRRRLTGVRRPMLGRA